MRGVDKCPLKKNGTFSLSVPDKPQLCFVLRATDKCPQDQGSRAPLTRNQLTTAVGLSMTAGPGTACPSWPRSDRF